MVNDKNLLLRASERNAGLACEFDPTDRLGRTRMGGMHVHLRIRFSDGSAWLARILRHNYMSFSDEFNNQVLQSEYATLKWLEKVDVPAPRVYDYGLRGDPMNDVGVAYMLIEELPGTPLLFLDPKGD